MNLLILFLFIQFEAGIYIEFPENMPSEFKDYERNEIFKFFENQYKLREIKIRENNIFQFGKEEKLPFILKIIFTRYEFSEKEYYLNARCEIKIFDSEKRRIYSKEIERFIYLEDTTKTSFIYFLNSLNYTIYSFLSQIFPPHMEVIEVSPDYVILSNPFFPGINPGAWIKVFDEKGFPVAILKVEDIVADRIYTKIAYSENRVVKGYKGVLSFPPSGESGMTFSFSSLKIKADTGSYGYEKGIKPFDNFKYGFNFSLYYRWISLNRIGFNISFYPSGKANVWKMAVEMEKGLKFGKIILFTGAEAGVFLGSQKTKESINTTSVSFFISPLIKTEFLIFKIFSISLFSSYPFSQSLNSFWYERKGGTEYVPDSLLIYKEIKLKGPEIGLSFNYKLTPPGF